MEFPPRWTIAFLLGIVLLGSIAPAEETFGVPIPVIGIDPNEGTLLGVLLAVITEEEGRITRIMAPVAAHNELVGYSLDFNYFGFPAEDIRYKLYLSHTTEDFWGYRLEYYEEHFLSEFFDLSFKLAFERTASNRYYGNGPDSDRDDESNYTARDVLAEAVLTAEIWNDFYLAFTIRGKRKWVRKGVVEDIPSLHQQFPDVDGVDGGYSLPFQIAMEYDTRDSNVTPTSGVYAKIFFEIADDAILSTFAIRRYGAIGKIFFALDEEQRFITAVQGVLMYTEGDDIPFFESSGLGGVNTLRGFGMGRFYDNHSVLCNLEERIRLFRWLVGEIYLDIEAAFFLDVGQVTPSLRDIDDEDIQTVGGAGVRFVVRSQIVAKVDFGYGSEGTEIFAGLDYPF